MSHSTTVRRSAEKELKRVPAPDRRRIVEAIDGLKEDPPCRPRAEERSPGLAAHSGRRLARVIRSRRRDFGRIGVARRPPSRRLSPEGSMTALAAARVAPPVDSDVGEAPDALTLLLLPPSGGREGGDGVRTARRRGRWAAGHPPGPPSRGEDSGPGSARPPFSLLPPSGGRSGGGGPPLGAPASHRHRAKREQGRGPSARQAGGTPAHPGNSPMSGTGKVPVRAAEPLGQPPSRPPPFQVGGEKRQRPACLLTSPPCPGGRSDKAAHSRLFPGPYPCLWYGYSGTTCFHYHP